MTDTASAATTRPEQRQSISLLDDTRRPTGRGVPGTPEFEAGAATDAHLIRPTGSAITPTRKAARAVAGVSLALGLSVTGATVLGGDLPIQRALPEGRISQAGPLDPLIPRSRVAVEPDPSADALRLDRGAPPLRNAPGRAEAPTPLPPPQPTPGAHGHDPATPSIDAPPPPALSPVGKPPTDPSPEPPPPPSAEPPPATAPVTGLTGAIDQATGGATTPVTGPVRDLVDDLGGTLGDLADPITGPLPLPGTGGLSGAADSQSTPSGGRDADTRGRGA